MNKIKRIVDTGPDPRMPPGMPYDTGFMELADGRIVPITCTNHNRATWNAKGAMFNATEAYYDKLGTGERHIPRGDHAPGGLYDTRGT